MDFPLQGLLDGLATPALLVSSAGTVHAVNRQLIAVVGRHRKALVGTSFFTLSADPPDDLRAYLRKCAGSGDALVGRVTLRAAAGKTAFRAHGSRLSVAGDPAVFVRLQGLTNDPFRVLTEQIVTLNREIAERKRSQLALREALAQREMLFRELQHRVRNNAQLMLSLVASLRQGEADAVARATLSKVHERLRALANMQQLLNEGDGSELVDAHVLLSELADGISEAMCPPNVAVSTEADKVPIDKRHAMPVALVVNELMANAFKYAFPDGRAGTLTVKFRRARAHFVLEVADDGCAVQAPVRRSSASGLALVEMLAAQLRGRVTCEAGGGTRWRLEFPIRS